MKVIALQHSERNTLGLVGEMGVEFDLYKTYEDPFVPELGDAVGVVAMGGPQHVYSDRDWPSRDAELRLIRQALDAGVPILGVCLGSQLLAKAAGGDVYRRREPEIGFYPVTLTEAGRQDPIFRDCPPVFTPRHWHQDSFDMPPGAVRLASSDQCVEQGFRIGQNAWGLQFHFEMLQDEPATIHDEERLQAVKVLTPVAKQIVSNFLSVLHTSDTIAV